MRRMWSAGLAILLASQMIAANNSPSNLALVVDQTQETDPNDVRPDHCWNEDDVHFRRWVGNMSPGDSLVETELFCDHTLDGISAGGVGFRLTVWSKDNVVVKIRQPQPQEHDSSWPEPEYSYPDVLGETLLRVKGSTVTSACIVPAYSGEIGIGSLSGGTYTLTVTNPTGKTLRDVRVESEVRMARPGWQQGWCPLAHQNIFTDAKAMAKPSNTFTITYFNKTCGYDCQNEWPRGSGTIGALDGCLGPDEMLYVWAEGNLSSGQEWSYTYPTGDEEGGADPPGGVLCYGGIITAEILSYKRGDPQITLTNTSSYDGEVITDTGSSVCIISKPGIWNVSLTNIGAVESRNVLFSLHRRYDVTGGCS